MDGDRDLVVRRGGTDLDRDREVLLRDRERLLPRLERDLDRDEWLRERELREAELELL